MKALQESCDICKTPEGEDVACQFGDVGITCLTTQQNRLTGWSFLFPLENYRKSSKCPPSQRHSTGFSSRQL